MLTRAQYIGKYRKLADLVTRNTQIFPEIVLAISIIESQASIDGTYYPGQTNLASKYNNYFGIKADSAWKGKKVVLPTYEYVDGMKVERLAPFRVYDRIEDSFYDFVDFLYDNPRYKNAGVYNARTIQEQAQALQRAGYATNPHYANLVIALANAIDSAAPAEEINNIGGILVLAALLLIAYNYG